MSGSTHQTPLHRLFQLLALLLLGSLLATARQERSSAATAHVAPVAPLAASAGHLYVLNQINGGQNQIYGYAVNEATGALTLLAGFPLNTGGNGSAVAANEMLVVDRTNRRLYALNIASNTVSAFAINEVTGALTALPFSPLALGDGTWTTIAVHPSGSPLVVANRNDIDPAVASFTITPATATAAAGSPYLTGNVAVLSAAFSQSGAVVYLGGSSSGGFAGFSVNTGTGVLAALAGSPFAAGASDPRSLVTDAAGRIFMSNNLGLAVRAFTTASGIPTGVTGNPFASGLTNNSHGLLHPFGFYLVAGGNTNVIGSFQIGGSGAATTLAAVAGSPFSAAGGSALTSTLEFNQDRRFLYAAHLNTRNLTTYSFNACAGALTTLGTQAANTLGTAGGAQGLAYLPSSQPPVVTAPDLSLVKTDGGVSFQINSTGAYNLTVSNATGAGATTCPITVTDTLPGNLTLASFTGTGWTCSGTGTANVSCTHAGPLAANASLPVLTLTANVGAGTPTGASSITNTATVSTPGETNAANNSGSDTTTVLPAPDLTVTKTDNNQTFFIGGIHLYTINVSNVAGAGTTTGTITVSDTLPGNLTLAGFAGTNWNCTGVGTSNVSCTHPGPLAGNAQLPPLTLSATVGTGTPTGTNSITNTASVSTPGETNTANNTGSDTTTVVNLPNLSLTKTDGGATFTVGLTGDYVITVANAAGAGPTTGTITVSDTLPGNLTLHSFSGTGWTCSGAGTANVSCTHAGPVNGGAALPALTLKVNVNAGTPTGTNSLTNTATVSTPGETATGDNSASDTTTVVNPSGLNGHLYVLNQSIGAANQIFAYEVDEATGALTLLAGFPINTGGTGVNLLVSEMMALDPLNRRLYVVNDGSNTVSAFAINITTGALTALPFSPLALGTGSWDALAVHPSGSPLVVVNEGATRVLASFQITATTATAAADSPYSASAGPALAFSQDGGFLYNGGTTNSSFIGFSVNAATGVLTPLAGSPFGAGAPFPVALATDNAGRLFTGLGSSNQLRVFTTASGIPTGVTGNPSRQDSRLPIRACCIRKGFTWSPTISAGV